MLEAENTTKKMNCLRKPIFYPIKKIIMRTSNLSTRINYKNMEINECVLGIALKQLFRYLRIR